MIQIVKCPHCGELFSMEEWDKYALSKNTSSKLDTLLKLESKGKFSGMNHENYYDYGDRLVEEKALLHDWDMDDLFILPSMEYKYKIGHYIQNCLFCEKNASMIPEDDDSLKSYLKLEKIVYNNGNIAKAEKSINDSLFKLADILRLNQLIKNTRWNKHCGYTNNLDVIIELCEDIYSSLYKYQLIDLYLKEDDKSKLDDLVSEDVIYLYDLKDCETFVGEIKQILKKYNIKKNLFMRDGKLNISKKIIVKLDKYKINIIHEYNIT